MKEAPYYAIAEMIAMMDEPYRSTCGRLYVENRDRFCRSRGSTHNHQAWTGGYHDHIEDAMNYAILFYRAEASTGRPMPFSLTEALVGVFLHDLEKPWRFERDGEGRWQNTGLMENKAERAEFRWRKIAEYGIPLTPKLENAIRYAEGEGGDYRPDTRVSNELAAMVHMCDNYSARGRHDYPNADDPWSARRIP